MTLRHHVPEAPDTDESLDLLGELAAATARRRQLRAGSPQYAAALETEAAMRANIWRLVVTDTAEQRSFQPGWQAKRDGFIRPGPQTVRR